MRIGYNTWSMATVPYQTFIPALAEIGFRSIAISVIPAYMIGGRSVANAGALSGLGADDRRRIKAELEARDIALPSVVGNQSLVHTDADGLARAVSVLKQSVDLSVELAVDGAIPTLNTGIGGQSGDLEDPSKQPAILDALGELADYAAARGVVVCIEPHVSGAVDSLARAEWLVRSVDRDALRLDFDVSHFEVQGVPMEESIARLVPLSAAAEIKDQHCRTVGSTDRTWVAGNGEGRSVAPDGEELEFQFLLADEGTFDLPRYLRLMRDQAWQEPIAFEVSVQCQARPDYDALAAARGIYEWMAQGWRDAGISED